MDLDRINPGQLRVLGAMLDMRREGRPVTYRGIMRRLGLRHVNSVQWALNRLRDGGLVYPGERPTTSAALRPTVRFIPEDQL